MNRLIKFRGKRTDTGEWIYGSLLRWENEDCEIIAQKSPIDCDKVTVDPDTVGQFTGLLDKNKREVYEGDIIVDNVGYRGKICWDEELLEWFVLFDTRDSDTLHLGYECEVIGSVHDNLEGGSKMAEFKKAAEEYAKKYPSETYRTDKCTVIPSYTARNSFIAGAQWQAEQSPWISVEERSLNGRTNKIAYLYGKILSLNGCDLAELDELLELTMNEGFVSGELNANQSPWISVEERMPDMHKNVLLKVKDCGVLIGLGLNAKDSSLDITHWCPIPE